MKVSILWVTNRAQELIVIVLAIAGVLKFYDLREFRLSLEEWTLIPEFFRPVMAIGVPSFEIVLFAALVTGMLRRHAASVIATGFVFLATSLFIAQWAMIKAPDCACFGKVYRYEQWVSEAWATLIRNAAILIVGVIANAAGWRWACAERSRSRSS